LGTRFSTRLGHLHPQTPTAPLSQRVRRPWFEPDSTEPWQMSRRALSNKPEKNPSQANNKSKQTPKIQQKWRAPNTHTKHTPHTLTQAEKQTQSLQHFFAWQPPNCNINRLAKVS